MIRIRLIIFYGILLFLTSGFKVLDPKSYNPFLAELEEFLDRYGIDIVLDWQSEVQLEGRPVIAPIANYKVSVLAKQTKWIKAFSTNYANAVVVMDTEVSVTELNFLKEWNTLPSHKKIFISFTKKDIKHAEIIKRALEEKGYKVFLYKESHREAFTSPKLIAQCMRDAGKVLILDTENSRNKNGVIAEALTYAKYKTVPSVDITKSIDDIVIKLNDEFSKNIDISTYNKKQLIEESIEFYKDIFNKEYTKEEVSEKLLSDYAIDLNNIKDFNFKSNDLFYQKIIETSEKPQLYNQLNRDLNTLKKYSSPTNQGNFVRFLLIIEKLRICPYYKIPKGICPICNSQK